MSYRIKRKALDAEKTETQREGGREGGKEGGGERERRTLRDERGKKGHGHALEKR